MAHDTQFSPEEVEELKRLFKEHAPPDGVITYKGRKIQLKPPEAKTITVKETSITSKPHHEWDAPDTRVQPELPNIMAGYLKTVREAAAKRALEKPHPPLDPKLLLHVDWPEDKKEKEDKEKEDKET